MENQTDNEITKPEAFTDEALLSIINAISTHPPTALQVARAIQAFRDEKWRQYLDEKKPPTPEGAGGKDRLYNDQETRKTMQVGLDMHRNG